MLGVLQVARTHSREYGRIIVPGDHPVLEEQPFIEPDVYVDEIVWRFFGGRLADGRWAVGGKLRDNRQQCVVLLLQLGEIVKVVLLYEL
jgi:hypothetical protein